MGSDGCRWNATKSTFSQTFWFQQLGLTTNPLVPGAARHPPFRGVARREHPYASALTFPSMAGTVTGDGVKDFKPRDRVAYTGHPGTYAEASAPRKGHIEEGAVEMTLTLAFLR